MINWSIADRIKIAYIPQNDMHNDVNIRKTGKSQ